MNKDSIYTMTIKMAQGGTEHIENGKESSSTAGHMWYTLAKDGEQTDSFGFGPKEYGISDVFGMYTDGEILPDDDSNYQATYATYEVRITKEQYDKLQHFHKSDELKENGFNDHYKVAANSCVDYVWRAMEFAGVNPDKFQGDMLPKNNRDNVNEHLYQAINDTHIPKEEHALEKTASDGSFDAIYGSKGDDTLTSTMHTEAVYGGKGNDHLNGIARHQDRLRGGSGDDTYTVQNGDSIKDSDQSGKVYFDATLLCGVKHRVSEGVYEDAMFTYTEKAQNLIISQKADPSKSVTIENWDRDTHKALGIELCDEKEAQKPLELNDTGMVIMTGDNVVSIKDIEEPQVQTYALSPNVDAYLEQFKPNDNYANENDMEIA